MNIPIKIVVSLILTIHISCISTSNISEENQEIISESEIKKQNLANAHADSLAEEKAKEEKLRKSLTKIHKDEMYAQYQDQANTLSNYYVLAQQEFYARNYKNALVLINHAAIIKESADVLALRGSIYLGLGDIKKFVSQWRKALEMDPDVPIPIIADIIQQLQAYGLLDVNLKKAF